MGTLVFMWLRLDVSLPTSDEVENPPNERWFFICWALSQGSIVLDCELHREGQALCPAPR